MLKITSKTLINDTYIEYNSTQFICINNVFLHLHVLEYLLKNTSFSMIELDNCKYQYERAEYLNQYLSKNYICDAMCISYQCLYYHLYCRK